MTFTYLQEIVQSAITQKTFPGAVIGITSLKGRWIIPFGKYTYEKDAGKITEESVFDVASVTKTIPTSLLALKLIEQKKLDLQQSVQSILPNFQGKWKAEVTVFHLLTQSVDFGLQLSLLKDKKPDEIMNSILKKDLLRKPGTSYTYINSTSIVLGLVIEKVSGKKLPDLAKDLIFDPLDMKNTTFNPSRFSKDRIVPTEIDPWRGRELRGEVHDESAFTLSKKHVVGSAGLFSTTPDLLNVLEMLLQGGTYKGKRIFRKMTIEQMRTDQQIGLSQSVGLGWEMNKEFMGNLKSQKTIGKTGYTGCCVLMDFEKHVGIVILSNHQYPTRNVSRDKYLFRSNIIDAVLRFLS